MNTHCSLYINKFNLQKYLNKTLLNNISIVTFEKGEYISNINEPLNSFYFLVDGKAKVTTEVASGKTLLLSFYTPLSVIGDVEFLHNNIADCNVIALDKSILLSIPLSIVNKYGYDDPIFLRFIIEMLSKKLRNNSNSSPINIYYSLEKRFASYLLSIRSKDEIKNNTIEIESLSHIAELLGSSYRNLTRIIKSLTDDNIINKKGNLITVLNIKHLEKIACDSFIEF